MAIRYQHTAQLTRRAAAAALMHPRRRAALPALAKGEHPLLRETDAGGNRYIATKLALYRGAGGGSAWRRLAWPEVATVEHSARTRALTLRGWPEANASPIEIQVRDRSRLPAFARERVTACQIITRRIDIAAGCAVTITALQETGTDTATWTVRLDPGCHRDDPAVALAIDRALRELRAQTGC